MEPTRQEWKDWAAVMAVKERPKMSYLYQLFGMSPEAYTAGQLQQRLAQQYGGTFYQGMTNSQSKAWTGILGSLGGALGL